MRQQPTVNGPVMRVIIVTRMSAWSTSPVLQPTLPSFVSNGSGPPDAQVGRRGVVRRVSKADIVRTLQHGPLGAHPHGSARTFKHERLDDPRAAVLHGRYANRTSLQRSSHPYIRLGGARRLLLVKVRLCELLGGNLR
jgi:hypothetical protein